MRPFIYTALFFLWSGLLIGQNLENLDELPPLQLSGNIRLASQYYTADGLPPRANPFMWNASGSVVLQVYSLRLPFSFTLGQHRPNLRYPTFNQFGISPSYKWITLHAGYRNMLFSRYTLNNHTFLGGGIELNPGKLRFAAMIGQLQQGIREIDNEIDLLFGAPVYNRQGYGVKVGVGGQNSFFDLIFFRAQDTKLRLEEGSLPDSLLPPQEENTVLGFHWQQQIIKGLSLDIEAAVSAFDRRGDATPLDLDNETANLWINRFFTPSYASQAGLATRGSLRYQLRSFRMSVLYERIDPGYRTMGAYFFANDLENWLANTGFALAKGKVRLQGSFGLQHNNLYNTRATANWRRIGSGVISINPVPVLGLDLTYSNFNIENRPGTILVLNDTLRVASATNQYGANLRYSILPESGQITNVLLSANYQNTLDDNPLSELYTEVEALFLNLSVHQIFANRSTQASLGVHYNTVTSAFLESAGYGANGQVRQSFRENTLQLQLTNAFTLNEVGEIRDGWTNSLQFRTQWKLHPQHALSLGLFWIQRKSTQLNAFSEYRGQLQYIYTLPTIGGKKNTTSNQ
ncbi:MAG: hypothetical protein AAGH79_01815 [Bacteroidota bacterium]